MNIRFISDPGHGWIEVPMNMIDQLGIRHKISPYSYRKGEFAYLEEDCDAGEFVNACKSQGIIPQFTEVYEEYTAIRSYARFA
jgi:hypothetical protein